MGFWEFCIGLIVAAVIDNVIGAWRDVRIADADARKAETEARKEVA